MANKIEAGYNTTLIKNGVDVGTTTTVNSGDQIAIRTTAPNTLDETSTIILTIGDDAHEWLVTAAAPAPLPAVPAGEMSGYTAGEFNVTPTGAATYRIPITVSPGTGGMEPQLSLAYSSQNGNGPVGMGWAMAGLSAIARCPATLAQDNFIDPVDFDDNDKFCLDGERLVAISGDYGANGTEYRTEHASFQKIISYRDSGPDPQYFKVWTKAGLIMEYGNSSDSRIEASGRSEAMFWALNKTSDTLGNFFTVTYQEETGHTEYRPIQIDYTGNSAGLDPYNSVVFSYDSRADYTPHFLAGVKFQTTKKLVKVEARNFGNLFREYRLSYGVDLLTYRSHLISITECGNDGTCFAPTTFEWQSPIAEDFVLHPVIGQIASGVLVILL